MQEIDGCWLSQLLDRQCYMVVCIHLIFKHFAIIEFITKPRLFSQKIRQVFTCCFVSLAICVFVRGVEGHLQLHIFRDMCCVNSKQFFIKVIQSVVYFVFAYVCEKHDCAPRVYLRYIVVLGYFLGRVGDIFPILQVSTNLFPGVYLPYILCIVCVVSGRIVCS